MQAAKEPPEKLASPPANGQAMPPQKGSTQDGTPPQDEDSRGFFGELKAWVKAFFGQEEENEHGRKMSPSELEYADVVQAALERKPKEKARMLSLVTVSGLFIFIAWAAWAEVDEVTRAEGKVVASQRTQIIQNLEGGILQAILVNEGQIITQGTPLARLDNEMAASTFRDALSKSLEHRAAIIRLTAELNGSELVLSEDILKDAPQLLEDQKAIMQARLRERNSELRLLESQYEQKIKEVEEQEERKKTVDRNLSLVLERREAVTPLYERGNYSRLDFLSLEQEVSNLEGESNALGVSIPKSHAAAREALERIAFREAELDSAITSEINERRVELNSLRETLAAGSDRVTRTVLRSPVNGTIQRIHLNTIGGVVKPGEAIMEIVPLDDTLLVEVQVRPADVAFLHPNQKAMIKFSAYDFGVYGGLDGVLEQISADTIEDKDGEVFYLAKLRTNKSGITYHDEVLPIIPGMVATADILTGRKTILDYILKPILKAHQNALRER